MQHQIERDGHGRRWADKTINPRSVAMAIAVPLLVAVLTWGARKLGPAVEMPERFRVDSIRRDAELLRRDSVLNRVDSRVGAIYCNSLPLNRQAGCR